MKRVGFFGALWILIRMALPDRRSSLVIVTGLTAMAAGMFVLQTACYPWAHSLTFGPTLTGGWVGEVTPAVRGTHIVLITVWDQIGDGGDDLSGTARMCDSRGEWHDFGVSGRTRNWRGTRFSLNTYITEQRDGEGVRIGTLDGEWDRGDALRVTSKLLLFRIRNGGSSSSTARSAEQIALEDPDVRFTLTRGSEQDFRAACDRLVERSRPGTSR